MNRLAATTTLTTLCAALLALPATPGRAATYLTCDLDRQNLSVKNSDFTKTTASFFIVDSRRAVIMTNGAEATIETFNAQKIVGRSAEFGYFVVDRSDGSLVRTLDGAHSEVFSDVGMCKVSSPPKTTF